MDKLSKLFNSFKNHVYKVYGPNPAKMLIYTGVIGWFLSSAAQVMAIAVNNKIPKEQKAFLIPQEIGDGAINVLSFFLVTSAIKGIASKLVSTGKIASKPVREFLLKSIKEGKLNAKEIGNIGFDISKTANFAEIKPQYDSFKKGTDVIGMTVGSILSCNIITPLIRNNIAAKRQVKTIAHMHGNQKYTYPRVTMDNYLNSVSMRSGSLRV